MCFRKKKKQQIDISVSYLIQDCFRRGYFRFHVFRHDGLAYYILQTIVFNCC